MFLQMQNERVKAVHCLIKINEFDCCNVRNETDKTVLFGTVPIIPNGHYFKGPLFQNISHHPSCGWSRKFF